MSDQKFEALFGAESATGEGWELKLEPVIEFTVRGRSTAHMLERTRGAMDAVAKVGAEADTDRRLMLAAGYIQMMRHCDKLSRDLQDEAVERKWARKGTQV